MKKQFILLLLGAFVFFAQGQEVDQPADPSTSTAAMVKEVLGQVYTEVGHIPEPQWFEMEPVAEEYVTILFQARTMNNGAAATKLVNDAWKKFESTIDTMLTEAQKSVRRQKRAERDIWLQQIEAQFQIAIDSARTEFDRMGSDEVNHTSKSNISSYQESGENGESVKTVRIEFK